MSQAWQLQTFIGRKGLGDVTGKRMSNLRIESRLRVPLQGKALTPVLKSKNKTTKKPLKQHEEGRDLHLHDVDSHL
jgi:hypothetical protein